MNSILAAAINGGILGAMVTAVVWMALAVAPRRALNAATRYAVWWGTLAIVISLPALFFPSSTVRPRVASATVVIPPNPRATLAEGSTLVAEALARRPARFPIAIAAGPWPRRLMAMWILTAFCMLLRLALSYLSLERKKSRASIPPVRVAVQTGRKGIRLASSGGISAPMASGPRRPTILIPSRLFDELSEDELEQIGLHEAAHLARRDDYALILQRVIEALFPLHPVVRWIARRIDLEREIACDDFVLAATGRPLLYAACLTRVTELTGGVRGPLVGTAAAGKNSHLSRRVEMLLDKTRHTGTRLLRLRFAVIATALVAVACMAARSPRLVAFAGPPRPTPAALPPPVTPPPTIPPIAHTLIAQAPVPVPPVPRPAVPPPPSATPEVLVAVSVRDQAGIDVADLGAQDFQVFEDGVPQRVSVFRQATEPVAIGIVLSVADVARMQAWRDALARVVARVNPLVEVSIFPTDRGLVNTDAVLGIVTATAKRLSDAPGGRKALFWATDQPDTAVQDKTVSAPDVMILSETVDDPSGLERAAAQLTSLTSTNYVLGFEPQNKTPDGRFRQLKVTVDRPSLTIRSRSGYFASKN